MYQYEHNSCFLFAFVQTALQLIKWYCITISNWNKSIAFFQFSTGQKFVGKSDVIIVMPPICVRIHIYLKESSENYEKMQLFSSLIYIHYYSYPPVSRVY